VRVTGYGGLACLWDRRAGKGESGGVNVQRRRGGRDGVWYFVFVVVLCKNTWTYRKLPRA
jgi:hypothetical protein